NTRWPAALESGVAATGFCIFAASGLPCAEAMTQARSATILVIPAPPPFLPAQGTLRPRLIIYISRPSSPPPPPPPPQPPRLLRARVCTVRAGASCLGARARARGASAVRVSRLVCLVGVLWSVLGASRPRPLAARAPGPDCLFPYGARVGSITSPFTETHT